MMANLKEMPWINDVLCLVPLIAYLFITLSGLELVHLAAVLLPYVGVMAIDVSYLAQNAADPTEIPSDNLLARFRIILPFACLCLRFGVPIHKMIFVCTTVACLYCYRVYCRKERTTSPWSYLIEVWNDPQFKEFRVKKYAFINNVISNAIALILEYLKEDRKRAEGSGNKEETQNKVLEARDNDLETKDESPELEGAHENGLTESQGNELEHCTEIGTKNELPEANVERDHQKGLLEVQGNELEHDTEGETKNESAELEGSHVELDQDSTTDSEEDSSTDSEEEADFRAGAASMRRIPLPMTAKKKRTFVVEDSSTDLYSPLMRKKRTFVVEDSSSDSLKEADFRDRDIDEEEEFTIIDKEVELVSVQNELKAEIRECLQLLSEQGKELSELKAKHVDVLGNRESDQKKHIRALYKLAIDHKRELDKLKDKQEDALYKLEIKHKEELARTQNQYEEVIRSYEARVAEQLTYRCKQAVESETLLMTIPEPETQDYSRFKEECVKEMEQKTSYLEAKLEVQEQVACKLTTLLTKSEEKQSALELQNSQLADELWWINSMCEHYINCLHGSGLRG